MKNQIKVGDLVQSIELPQIKSRVKYIRKAKLINVKTKMYYLENGCIYELGEIKKVL